jgi:hypothetical protein
MRWKKAPIAINIQKEFLIPVVMAMGVFFVWDSLRSAYLTFSTPCGSARTESIYYFVYQGNFHLFG